MVDEICVQLIHRRKPSRTCNCSGHIPGHGICGGGLFALCGVIFEADILTEIVMHLTCLLFKVLLLSMFFCTCASLFFFESISLDKNKKESFRLLHRERKSGRVPRKVLVQRRRLPERKHPKKAAS